MIFTSCSKKILLSLFAFGIGVFPLLANQQIQQEVLKAAQIKKFVEPLPTSYGKRVDGTRDLTVSAKEFQQYILPENFYKELPPSVNYKCVKTGENLFSINPREGTYVWGYEVYDGKTTYGPSYPGPTIVAKRGVETKVTYKNCLFPFKDHRKRCLPGPLLQKFLTVDCSMDWANPKKWPRYGQGIDIYDPIVYPYGTGLPQGNPAIYQGPPPMVVHLHGAEVSPCSDGNPTSWFTPCQKLKGYSYVTNKYCYPNSQPVAFLWYHDHTHGVTRLNVYAGLVGCYLMEGEPDQSVSPRLPCKKFETEMAIQDRQFDRYGQCFFPDGNAMDAGLNGYPETPLMTPYAIPEFFGDVMCVNGKSWPYLEVEPRRYRFRLLNACNARMLALYVTCDDSSKLSVPPIWQIGTDGGLLDYPVNIDSFIPFTCIPSNECLPQDPSLGPVFQSPRLFFAPGERMDVIIDFAGYEGCHLTLNNDAPAPFPNGGTLFDPEGVGKVLQFRVKKKLSSQDESFDPAVPGAVLRKGDQAIVRLVDPSGNLSPRVVPDLTRLLTMIEHENPFTQTPEGVYLNNTSFNGLSPYNRKPIKGSVPYYDGKMNVTEMPQVGSTEIWEVVNLTPDTHPIHLHLIEFQILNRQLVNIGNIVPPFICAGSYRNRYETVWDICSCRPPGVPPGTVYGYGPPLNYLKTAKLGGNPDVTPYLIGPPIPCDLNEYGWKDTVKMHPGTVTRLVVRWIPQDIPLGGVKPGENLFGFDPTKGPGYLFHCHILDHEDHDMMRPIMLRYESQKHCLKKVPKEENLTQIKKKNHKSSQ